MKSTTRIVLFVVCAGFAASLWAQQKKTDKKSEATATKSKYSTSVPAYLGHSTWTGGYVPKNVLDSLLKQGVVATDSAGNNYKVVNFRFNYAERHLYEDSIGNDMILTDYMIEYCPGDTLSASIASSIYQRTKEGDTVYIDQINLVRPDDGPAVGKAMKFVVTQ
jgi:hypothetical protein